MTTRVYFFHAIGSTVLPACDLRLAVLLHCHHYHAEPHFRCDHRHVRGPEKRETAEGGDPEEHVLRVLVAALGVRQQEHHIRGAHQTRAQPLALPVLHRSPQSEGPD